MRVCLYGGPGVGKTSLAHWLTSELSRAGVHVEYVDEWVKRWAYEKRQINGWDQYHIFSNQLEKEEFFLRHGVGTVVTDSPLLMQTAYMQVHDNRRFLALCMPAVRLFEEEFPSVNIFLERGDLPYRAAGRWQTAEEAREVDGRIKALLDENVRDFYEFPTTDWKGILDEVFLRLKSCC